MRALASRQHGVVTRAQLEALGLSADQIKRRLGSAHLAAVHRGVFAVGHDSLSPQARWTAALLAVGDGAVLSHRSAAALWDFASEGAQPEVTLPRSSRRGPAIRTHRAVVPDDEQQSVDGIAVTSPSRTLLDLAATMPLRFLERAHREAHVLGLPIDLDDLLARYPGRRGTRKVRSLLGAPIPKSRLESKFRRFLKARGIPLPDAINVLLPWGEADCVWWDAHLTVELDGHSTHRTRAQFERDRARDRQAVAAGWRVVRITWRQLAEEPDLLAGDLRLALAARSAL